MPLAPSHTGSLLQGIPSQWYATRHPTTSRTERLGDPTERVLDPAGCRQLTPSLTICDSPGLVFPVAGHLVDGSDVAPRHVYEGAGLFPIAQVGWDGMGWDGMG